MIRGPKIGRRDAMLAGLAASLSASTGTGLAAIGAAQAKPANGFGSAGIAPAAGAIAQTAMLQQALDEAAASGEPLFLPAGTYRTGRLVLKSGTQVHGVPGQTVLRSGSETIFEISAANTVRLSGLVLDGTGASGGEDGALFAATDASELDISDCRFLNSGAGGVTLRKTAGRIVNCEFGTINGAALLSENAQGFEIRGNHIHDCGDNGILVWRSEAGEDGTIVSGNHIERIAAKSGGSGQNGNGVTVLRAGSVLVTQNRIAECAFSAIRIKAASNCQLIANSCARLGDVALDAELGFEGVMVANNIVDTAATGISVTNFNEIGAHAVVQGNIIRNLFLRKTGEARGTGICVDANGTVIGNVVEGAPAYGMRIGRGNYLRDLTVSSNVIRKSYIGIGVSVSSQAGSVLITDNLINGARDGAIRAMKGPTPIGSDLALERTASYRNLAVHANRSS